MIILDYYGIAIPAVLSKHAGPLDENFIKHMVLNSIRMHNLKFRDKFGALVVACDEGSSWRKRIFPNYKFRRKEKRDTSDIDWSLIFKVLNSMRDELREYFPFAVVYTNGAEADDVIATLIKNRETAEPALIIGADRDYLQLQEHANVYQYDPRQKKFLKEEDPANYLFHHIMKGCSGDGVPNVRSSINSFVEGTRQSPVTQTFINSFDVDTVSEELKERFIQNTALISFECIPEDIDESIMAAYSKELDRISMLNNQRMFNYLVKNRMSNLLESIQDFKSGGKSVQINNSEQNSLL